MLCAKPLRHALYCTVILSAPTPPQKKCTVKCTVAVHSSTSCCAKICEHSNVRHPLQSNQNQERNRAVMLLGSSQSLWTKLSISISKAFSCGSMLQLSSSFRKEPHCTVYNNVLYRTEGRRRPARNSTVPACAIESDTLCVPDGPTQSKACALQSHSTVQYIVH